MLHLELLSDSAGSSGGSVMGNGGGAWDPTSAAGPLRGGGAGVGGLTTGVGAESHLGTTSYADSSHHLSAAVVADNKRAGGSTRCFLSGANTVEGFTLK